jgi:hypothetical protein
MLRKIVIAIVADAVIAFEPTGASARGGFGGGCAYPKSNPDIFVMQSAEDRAAKNTPRLLYGAR